MIINSTGNLSTKCSLIQEVVESEAERKMLDIMGGPSTIDHC